MLSLCSTRLGAGVPAEAKSEFVSAVDDMRNFLLLNLVSDNHLFSTGMHFTPSFVVFDKLTDTYSKVVIPGFAIIYSYSFTTLLVSSTPAILSRDLNSHPHYCS